MEIKQASFVTSISQFEKYIEVSSTYSSNEICVIGRSNVGKSSFINMLANQKKLAKTSSTPGRTRLINLFDFNLGAFMLVDLPGYGYALASKGDKNKWGELIEGYLQNSKKLAQVFLLLDCRHEPSTQDLQMVHFLYHYQLPFTVIITKCDKLSKSEMGRCVQKIASAIKIGVGNLIAVSAETKYNREKVLARMEEVLGNFVPELQDDDTADEFSPEMAGEEDMLQ